MSTAVELSKVLLLVNHDPISIPNQYSRDSLFLFEVPLNTDVCYRYATFYTNRVKVTLHTFHSFFPYNAGVYFKAHNYFYLRSLGNISHVPESLSLQTKLDFLFLAMNMTNLCCCLCR